jgi:thioredoxin 1
MASSIMSETITHADDTSFQATVLESDKLVLVDFWAEWCGPCKTQAPVLERLQQMRKDVSVVKVNVDESPTVASTYGIRSIPTLAVFAQGKVVLAKMGLQNLMTLNKLLDAAAAKTKPS